MTRHFSLAELCESDYATRRGLPNRPGDAQVKNLNRLMRALEDVRLAVGSRPVVISSGYRSPEVNRGVGGSRTSAHMDGRAADIKVIGLTPIEVALLLRDSGLPFDQLIYEGKWVHVGIAPEGEEPRGDMLTALFSNGGVRYVRGIQA